MSKLQRGPRPIPISWWNQRSIYCNKVPTSSCLTTTLLLTRLARVMHRRLRRSRPARARRQPSAPSCPDGDPNATCAQYVPSATTLTRSVTGSHRMDRSSHAQLAKRSRGSSETSWRYWAFAAEVTAHLEEAERRTCGSICRTTPDASYAPPADGLRRHPPPRSTRALRLRPRDTGRA